MYGFPYPSRNTSPASEYWRGPQTPSPQPTAYFLYPPPDSPPLLKLQSPQRPLLAHPRNRVTLARIEDGKTRGKWNLFSSEKVLQMSYAHYQCIMDERLGWQPEIFYSDGPEQGLPEPFPAPTHLRRKERGSYTRGPKRKGSFIQYILVDPAHCERSSYNSPTHWLPSGVQDTSNERDIGEFPRLEIELRGARKAYRDGVRALIFYRLTLGFEPLAEPCRRRRPFFGFHHDGDQARGSFLRPPQAATGKLNIARHKSYHPYRCENIEKVRHDEEEARRNEAKEEGRMLLADSEAWVDLFSEGRAGVKESSTVEYGVQTILAPPAYTSLSPFQRPPQSKHPRTRFTHARWHSSDAERAWVSRRVWMRTDLHARLCACQHAALFSISSNSTSSFAHSDPTHIAGGALLHAHGDCPPFPVCDATLECGPFTRTVLSVPYEGTMIHTSFILPSDPSRVLLHSSFFLPPSTSTSRFELPFVILALVVRPSSPLPLVLCAHPLCLPSIDYCVSLGPAPPAAPPLPPSSPPAHQALHNPTSIATLRTKARPKPKPSTTRTTTRGGADTEVLHAELADVRNLAGILILLREGGEMALELSCLFTRHAFPLPGLFVSPPSSVRAVYYAPSPVLVRRLLDGRRTNDSVHTPTDDCARISLRVSLLFPVSSRDYLKTSSMPPFTTRMTVWCSWLVVLELCGVIGMWLRLAAIIFVDFLLSLSFFAAR
ncbi:hypothetical protein K438DRAFT_1930736 [Mycena galopus ATCC 62051]|nr:hypothetical protein K438DRAFT_1930736 [Mycena galopus ATCC 62051]